MGGCDHGVTGSTMSTHDDDDTQNTINMTERTWTDVSGRGIIVTRPRRFHGLTHREGFADYVEKAYWTAQSLGLLEELAMIPETGMTDLAFLTQDLAERIRERMWEFNEGCGPNVYYGALVRMIKAAKEDVGEPAPAPAPTELPPIPWSPLIRQSGVGADIGTMSDSEFELGKASVGWPDISGFVRPVSGIGDDASPAHLVEEEDEDAHSDSGPDSEHEVTSPVDIDVGEEADCEVSAEEDNADHSPVDEGEEDNADHSPVDEGEEASADHSPVDEGEEASEGEDSDDHSPADEGEEDSEGEEVIAEEDGLQIQHIQHIPATPFLQKYVVIESPVWVLLVILVAFTAWAALVNGALSQCKIVRR